MAAKSTLPLNLIKFNDKRSSRILVGRGGKTFRFDVSFDEKDLTVFTAKHPSYGISIKGFPFGTLAELIDEICDFVFNAWDNRANLENPGLIQLTKDLEEYN